MSLSKDQILGFRPRVEKLSLPEWGGDVYIRPLSVANASRYMKLAKEEDLGPEILTRLVVMSACDEAGNLLFSLDDTAALSEAVSLEAIKKVSDAALKLNLLSEGSDEVAAKN